ncbi:MAG: hypothetical protein LW832_05430, partial [Parachlamydia sp.]|nr:hypothetical protein [Parachlamydia sp.]
MKLYCRTLLLFSLAGTFCLPFALTADEKGHSLSFEKEELAKTLSLEAAPAPALFKIWKEALTIT